MEIRRAVLSERAILVDIWLRSVRATHHFLTELDIAELLPQTREYLTSEEPELWVLCSETSEIMGFMGIDRNKVDALFLAPEFQRQGGGRSLIRHAQELRGELTVDVNEQNLEARKFYLACGFVVERRSDNDGSGRPFPLLHMRLAAPTSDGMRTMESPVTRSVVQQFRVEPEDDTGSVMRFLEDRIYEYNSKETGRDDGRLFSKVVRDTKGDIVAGVAGWTWAAVCEITQLWVSSGVRNRGIGKLLLQAAESEARDKNCVKVLVKTYSFQAPQFYEKHGYNMEHVTENFPEGHRYYTLIKAI